MRQNPQENGKAVGISSRRGKAAALAVFLKKDFPDAKHGPAGPAFCFWQRKGETDEKEISMDDAGLAAGVFATARLRTGKRRAVYAIGANEQLCTGSKLAAAVAGPGVLYRCPRPFCAGGKSPPGGGDFC